MKGFKRILVLLVFLSGFYTSFAQQGKDRVEALRMAFISKKLELSNAESEKFWPVYNEYNDKVKAIRKNLRQSYRAKSENMSDKEAEELYQLDLQSRQAENDVHRLYSEKLKAMLGAKKFVKLRLAEEEFKREIIKTLKEGGSD